MARFTYNGYDGAGNDVAGSIEAETVAKAREKLRKDGLYPREIGRFVEKPGRFTAGRRKVNALELAQATRQISTLLSSGETLMNALAIVGGEVSSPALGSALASVREQVAGGKPLGSAMLLNTEVFPEMYSRMVEAAEESGTLDAVLSRLSTLLETKAGVSARIRSALVYPAVVTLVSACVLLFLVVFVIPRITRIFEDTEAALPFVTIALLAVVKVVRGYWFVLMGLLIAAHFAVARYKKTEAGKRAIEELLLKTPYLGDLLRTFYVANFARTLSSLLSSGVPILKALDLTAKVLNHSGYAEVIGRACRAVTEGRSLSDGLRNSKLFPDLLVHMTAIGERSGSLDVLLDRAALAYEKDFERMVTRGLSLFEPALVVVMGAVVGFIVLAMLLPIFELNHLVR
jgi:general secretion pathway protein F